ncbi:transcriptional corepressor LEUNIG_HOMOLOG-like [Gastrolobium bilobum]|uniref:transcriptional corepressor LEUNIG_HOMOLOG-like n=1 Tax=Gastrolobium bilobum TaxID=150636 RepID=UPI002AAF39D8|nr:transcriptional corepressor LEUNIG_HOMOLOG-like [Gastrolobium bilobum]
MTSTSNDHGDWDPDKMLRLYIHDYMIKRGMHEVAEIFKNEAQLPNNIGVLHSPDGFLHEWWSIFYAVFTSRQRNDQEIGPESSSKVVPKIEDNARNSTPPRTPLTQMREQRPQQFQVSFSVDNMMAQPAACLIPSTVSDKQHLRYLAENVESWDLIKENNLKFCYPPQEVGMPDQKQVFKDRGIGMRVRRDAPTNPLDVVPRTLPPLDGPHETKTNEALNLAPLNGWPVKNQVLTSLLQTPDYRKRYQVLKTPRQDAVLALPCTTKSQTFTLSGNSTKFNSQYPKIPIIESSNEDRQMTDQLIRTVEHQYQQDQQMQMLSQNVEKSKKRKTTAFVRTGESALDCVDAADGKPVDENVESFLSLENEHADHRIVPFSNLKRISATYGRNEKKGFSFEEVGCLHSSKSKVLSSHFSSDGKVLASAGHEKKVFIWNMETLDCVATPEAHSHLVTDVRFRPDSTIFATSSFDRSVKLWDAARPTRSLLKFTGHAEQVMSLDFHPRQVDLLCSCDSNDVIRLWNVNQCVCMHITKGGSKQVRFQPRIGKFLATATGNNIKIVDVETDQLLYYLEGHVKDVISICWDRSGSYIASVSEDSARVWSVASDGKCISELHSNGNKFQSCLFHPGYLNLLIIGGYQSLELWSPTESSKTWAVPAHKGLIAGLADSPEYGLIASASHDHCVKLWK